MGILELHFHDSQFTLDVGRSDGGGVLSLGGETTETGGNSDGRSPITGKLMPLLVVLVAIGVTVLRQRRRRRAE
ncbi:hypothetical protein DMJ13_06075 [halophilic archaeon]|nr:hypothetical protein DMJ13_06075 [halophilic archaeon]